MKFTVTEVAAELNSPVPEKVMSPPVIAIVWLGNDNVCPSRVAFAVPPTSVKKSLITKLFEVTPEPIVLAPSTGNCVAPQSLAHV